MQLPYAFAKTADVADIRRDFEEALEAGEHTEHTVAVAGRILLRRVQGKLCFATMSERSGKIQLFAAKDSTVDFAGFTALSLGDWVGVNGTVMKTKRGELSIAVASWELLAEAKRQFPDKWHGITDPDIRYRQRYVDLWVTEGEREAFELRSKVVSSIRRFLDSSGFLEVETPILHPIPGGATARPFVTHHNTLDQDMYLRIAVELYLKRLVVGGFERVYELGRNFRNEGMSPRHNPEFTMLEWYEAYTDVNGVMDRSEKLVAHLAETLCGSTVIKFGGKEVDLTPPWPRRTMLELIAAQTGVLMTLDDPDTIHAEAEKHLKHIESGWGPGRKVLEIFDETVESTLWNPVFVTDYPKEVSPLARDHREKPGLTERFECFVTGRELMNGFSELVDPVEQRLRFEEEVKARDAGDEEAMYLDEDYIRALEYGMPPTGGIGIGIDRLVMLLADRENIKDVLLFPTLRHEARS